ncbi:autotransporter domain-containing protein [Bradyrhizobium commune]|uniref:Autotransporter domain-containing protein n=2 Tax=Bradyrhizobium commune TaxID=83627 RepID=A0A7S9DCG5_9BRAD|nr:autotransporter domain-containing protein [Bradyrhizobium commune]
MLLGGSSAWADCTPASANNVTATCTGATVNQGAGAPGTSAGVSGYGAGETGITVDVSNGASVTGNANANSDGIVFNSGTINNGAGASITGTKYGLDFDTAHVTNSGTITGSTLGGMTVGTSATITNTSGGTITGSAYGIGASSATIGVTNDGTISGTTNFGIIAGTATVTNNAGASITGPIFGIEAVNTATVTNSGTIAASAPGGGVGVGANSVSVTNNASGTITGGLYAINSNAGGSVVNTGTISGTSAAINLLGGNSSVFNAGTITVTGGLFAIVFSGSGNTLTLAPGSVITGSVIGGGNDTFQLGGTGAANFDASLLGPAQYGGFSTFNKVGDSTWTLTGSSVFAGAMNINAGTLLVNGDITGASTTTVNAGGTLGGTGTVNNVVVNGGVLAPGNGIGTLTVWHGLSFTAASTYMVQVSPSSADRTNVSGSATLGGATVQAVFAPGSYVARQYTILNASAGVSGTFGALVNAALPLNFSSSLSYDANNVYLNLTLNYALDSLSTNQRNVANTLTNFFNANGSISAVYGTLTASGLTQASGEAATGSQQATFNAMNQFMGVLTDPFVAGRGDPTTSAGTSSFAAGNGGSTATRAERDAYAAIFTKAPVAQVYDPRWSVWAAGFGGAQTTDGNAALGSNTATSSLAGVAVGADYRFTPDTVAGFALAGGGTSFSVDNSGYGRSDLFQAGAFVRHKSGPAYVSAALAYGFQDITTDRIVTIAGVDRLHAAFNANAYSGRIEGGYRFVTQWLGGVGLAPYGAAQFTTFDLPAYAEQALVGTPAFALAYTAKSVTDSRSELGARGDKSYALANAMLTLRGRLAWAHDFNADRSIGATFQALPGASFVVNGAAQPHDSALTTASAELRWMNGWSAAATFEGEFADTLRSYAGKGVVRYSW